MLAFFLLTFVVTWTTWVVPAKLVPGNAVLGVGGPVFLLGVFAPGIVGVALTGYREGRAGVARLLSRIVKWQVGGRYFAFALGYMAAAKTIAALIHRAVLGTWPGFGDERVLLMAGAILVSTWVQAGEEVGWRGYALPHLAKRWGLGPASILLGMIWALWHLPLFYIPGGGSEDLSFPIYVLYATSLSVSMAWLYWKTGGSLLLTMLMHASVNNTAFIPLTGAEPVNPMSLEGSLTLWATVGVSSAIAAVLLFRMRGAELDHGA